MKISDFSEKIDLKKADMGDVVKDFYKSDAPQFIGKSKKKRRQMAIAAKLSANESTGDLHDRLYDLEAALRSAREITKQIKYADTHMTVIGELEALAEKVGLKLDDYDVRQVYQGQLRRFRNRASKTTQMSSIACSSICAFQICGPVTWTDSPRLSTATLTGMSFTVKA